MQGAIRLLRDIKNPRNPGRCREIKTLEGDPTRWAGPHAALFKSGADALSIIKWRRSTI